MGDGKNIKKNMEEEKENCSLTEIASSLVAPDPRNDKGFTLVEVLFAIGAMTIFLVGMTAVLVKSLSSTEISKNRSQAAIYLQEGVEHARQCRDQADSWEDFVNDGCEDLDDVSPPFTEWTLEFEEIDSNKRKVTVDVEWTDGKGDHMITTDTILSKW